MPNFLIMPLLMMELFAIPARVSTCHPDLLDLAACVHEEIAIRIFSCHRTWEEQKKLCDEGKSQACRPGQSYHNRLPSEAMDMVPIDFKGGIDWADWNLLVTMNIEAAACAADLGLDLTHGMYWDSISDPYHFQLEL